MPTPLLFPCIVNKFFYQMTPRGRVGKVVCRTDVRSRQGTLQVPESMPTMTDVGDDNNFAGLHVEILEVEPDKQPNVVGGIYIPVAL